MPLNNNDLEKIDHLITKRVTEAVTGSEIRLEIRLETRLIAVTEKMIAELGEEIKDSVKDVVQDEIAGTESRLTRLIGEARLETQLLREETKQHFKEQDAKIDERFHSLRDDIDIALKESALLKHRVSKLSSKLPTVDRTKKNL